MSRDRAHRRAERERLAAERREAHERTVAREARRRHARVARRARLPRRTRWRGQQGILARRRRFQNGIIAGLFVLSQVLTWLLTGDPWARAASAVVGLLALPVLVTLTLDRRSGP